MEATGGSHQSSEASVQHWCHQSELRRDQPSLKRSQQRHRRQDPVSTLPKTWRYRRRRMTQVGSFRIKRVIRYSESRLLFGSRLADDFRVTYFLACIAQLNEYMK